MMLLLLKTAGNIQQRNHHHNRRGGPTDRWSPRRSVYVATMVSDLSFLPLHSNQPLRLVLFRSQGGQQGRAMVESQRRQQKILDASMVSLDVTLARNERSSSLLSHTIITIARPGAFKQTMPIEVRMPRCIYTSDT